MPSTPGGLDGRSPRSSDLRGVGYTAAIDLQGLLKSAVLARAVGAERTIGFAAHHLRERTAGPFYTHRVDPQDVPHVIFKNLALLEPLGSRDMRAAFPLEIPFSAVADAVNARFDGAPYAVINPGAAWPNKRWPADRFGALAAAIRDRFGLRSLVLWGPGEESLAADVTGASSGAAEAAPATSITDLFAIARRARDPDFRRHRSVAHRRGRRYSTGRAVRSDSRRAEWSLVRGRHRDRAYRRVFMPLPSALPAQCSVHQRD